MSAVDDAVADLKAFRQSTQEQPLICTVDKMVAALQQLQSGSVGGGGSYTLPPAAATGTQPVTFAINTYDASGGAFNVPLNPTPNDGDWVIIFKTDATTNRIKIQMGATDIAWLQTQNDDVILVFSATLATWICLYANIDPFTDVFTANGTWTKPPLSQWVQAFCFSGGNGGGSGRRGAAGSGRAGGQGGQGATVTRRNFNTANLGGTETITVGAGGNGGAAQTVNDTNGNAGGNGGTSSFGTHLRSAVAVGGGAGGTAAAAAFSVNNTQANEGFLGQGGGTSITATPSAGVSGVTGGGGSGGGITTGDAAQNGSVGGGGSTYSGTTVSGGSAGVVDTTIPTVGNDVINTNDQMGAGAGGGGAGSITTVAQTGANGGAPGGAGGGGGASLNGNNSGAGGNGGRGEVRITSYF